MSEAETSPQPTPPNTSNNQISNPGYKEKLSLFFKVIGGVIFALFVLVFLAEKMKSSVTEEKQQPTQTESTIPDDTNQPVDVAKATLDQLTEERKPAEDSVTASKTENQSTVTDAVKKVVSSNQLEQEKERFEALEYKRAVLSARSGWGLKERYKVSQSTSQPSKDITPKTRNDVPEELMSTDEQRLMIANRLKKMEELKQRILSGNYAPGEQVAVETNIQDMQQSFSSAPTDIVGYTEENKYNANTEGMEKLPIGTLIPAISIMKASSDRTGTFKGLVTQDIYDVDYEYVLVPKGSELIFKSFRMSTDNEALNTYVGYSVPWLILPNGKKIDTSKSSGLDREGLGGLSDQVDRHLLAQFMGVAAYALVANNTSYEGTGANTDTSYQTEVSEGLRDQLSPQVQKYLQLRPTNVIRTGQSMNVIIEDEIFLKPWKNVYEDYL
ncbi:TrbI/VirB10 family protein [Vibrio europaeus]|uniref:TrbI/VirB10 family protein n=1 Tax=Vibrio europaeus TaxID=300876 RepID=UPI00233E8F95|nr:TrbI/VirB10 family protein [Vibrio europaeus]MDC5711162.1 TrbI/VirB10 family protein [Vibrio europaeus]MDC5713191.1 TrbI/VirB10 family protein [Vibrio europaeus]